MHIHQDVSFEATPEAIYDVLVSAAKFAKMTGGRKATITAKTGGAISLFDGYISGRNLELVPGKRIVQAWRAKEWPEGVHSIVRFELSKRGKGAALAFDQIGHPENHHDHLAEGWVKMYWEPMKALLKGAPRGGEAA